MTARGTVKSELVWRFFLCGSAWRVTSRDCFPTIRRRKGADTGAGNGAFLLQLSRRLTPGSETTGTTGGCRRAMAACTPGNAVTDATVVG